MQAASIIAVGTRPGRGVSIALVCAREHGGRYRPAFKLVRKLDRRGEERGADSLVPRLCTRHVRSSRFPATAPPPPRRRALLQLSIGI